jgi:uncharacterized coiled-coil protein SlyX
MRRLSAGMATSALAFVLFGSGAAYAQSAESVAEALKRLEARIAEQDRLLNDQRSALESQKAELDRLRRLTDDGLADLRGAGPAAQAVVQPVIATADPNSPGGQVRPVGEAPPVSEPVEVASLPEGSGVLTPRGRLVYEPTLDYSHASSNRLVFRGIEIVTGVQIGVIEASDADRNTTSASWAFRYGLTDRLEVEARIPYIYRSDTVTTLVDLSSNGTSMATRTFNLTGKAIGDAEVAARYQINSGSNGLPILIAGLRVKSDTGAGPFDVNREAFGISTELPTGSGFWGVEPGLSFIYPTDPAVIFGGLTYLAHLKRDVNRTIGGNLVGEVDPGDSIGANAGFGFALNPRFSFSLGYKHNYIFPTKIMIAGTQQESESLQVGAFMFGWSFRLSEKLTVSNGYEIGTTTDSPDMRVSFRLPYRF